MSVCGLRRLARYLRCLLCGLFPPSVLFCPLIVCAFCVLACAVAQELRDTLEISERRDRRTIGSQRTNKRTASLLV